MAHVTDDTNIVINGEYSGISEAKDNMIDALGHNYFDSIPDVGLEMSELGFVLEHIGDITKDSLNTAVTSINEYFPATAIIPESITSHAAIFNIDNTFTQCANCIIDVILSEEEILKYGTKIINKDSGKQHTEFYLDKNTVFIINDIQYTLDYDVEIIIGEKNTDVDTSVSTYNAKYMISDIKNSISDIENPIIDIIKTPQGNIRLRLNTHQVIRNIITDSIINNTKINYPVLLFEFNSRLAGFDILYKASTDNVFRQLKALPKYSSPIGDDFCYYTLKDENTLEISFTSDSNYFQPEFNSDIQLIMYTTEGENANFETRLTTEVSVQTSSQVYEYNKNINIIARAQSNSSGAKDRLSNDLIKILTNEAYSTATNISTDNDLKIFFANYEEKYGDIVSVKKKYDDITSRLYCLYLLLKDKDYIFPTNTCILDINLNDFDVKTTLYDHPVYSLLPGHAFIYKDMYLKSASSPIPMKPDCPIVLAKATTTKIDKKRYSPQDAENLIDKYVWNADDGTYTITPAIVVEANSTNKTIETDEYEYAVYLGPVSGPYESIPKPTQFTCVYNLYHFLPCTDDDNIAPPYSVYWNDYCDVMGMADRKVEAETGPMYENMEIEYFDGWDIWDRETNDDTAWWVTDPEDSTRVYVYHQPYYWYSTRRLLTEARKENANPYGTKCVEHIEAETTDYWGNVDTCEFRPVKFKELQTMPYSKIKEMFGAYINDYTSNIKKARTRYKCEMSYCEVTQDSDSTVYIRIAEAYPTIALNAADSASSGVLWKYKKLTSSDDYVFDGGSTLLRAGALTSESTYARSNWMYDDYPLYTVSLFYLITTKNRNTIYAHEVIHETGYIDAEVIMLDEYDWTGPHYYYNGESKPDNVSDSYLLVHFSPASENCIPYYMQAAIEYEPDTYSWNCWKYTDVDSTTGEHNDEIRDDYKEMIRIFNNPMGKYTWVECYEDYDEELNSRVWYIIDVKNEPDIAYIYHECYYYPFVFAKGLLYENEIYSEGEGGSSLLGWYRFEYEYDPNPNDYLHPQFKPMEIQTIPLDQIPQTAKYLGSMPSTYKYDVSYCDIIISDDGDVIVQQYPYRTITTFDSPQEIDYGIVEISPWEYHNYHYTSYEEYMQDVRDNNLTIIDSFELHHGYLSCLRDSISSMYSGEYYAELYGIPHDDSGRARSESWWKFDGARTILNYTDYPEATVPLLRLLTNRKSSYIDYYHDWSLSYYDENLPTRCKEVNVSYIAEEPIKDIIETIDTDEFDLVIKLGSYGTSWADSWKNENAQESYALLHFSPATENCTAKILSDIADLHNSYSWNDERHGYEWNQFRDLYYHITRPYLVGGEEKRRTWNKPIDDIFKHRFSHPMSRYTMVEYYEDYDSVNKSKIWYVVDIEKDPNTAYIYNERDLYFDAPSGNEAIHSLYNSQNAFACTAERTAAMLFGKYMFEYNCTLSNILLYNWRAFNEYEFKTIPVAQIPSTAIKYPRARPTAYKYDVIRYDLISVDDSGEVIMEEFPFTDVDIFDEPKSTDQGFQPWQYTTNGDYTRQYEYFGGLEYQQIYTNYKAYYDDAIHNNRKLKRGLEQHTNFIFGTIEYLFDKYDDGRYNGIERSMYDDGDAGTIEWKANVLKSKLTYYDYPEDSVSLLKLLTTLRPRPGDYPNIKGLGYFSVSKPPDYGPSGIYPDTDARFPIPKNCKITKYHGEDFLTDEYEYFKVKNENNILYHLSPATENSVFGILGSMLNDKKNDIYPYDTNIIEYGTNRVRSLKDDGEQHGVDMSWIDEYLENTDYISAFYDHPMVRHTNIVYYEDFDDTLNSRVWYIVDVENEPNVAYVYHECYYKYFSRELDYQDIYCPDIAEYAYNIEWFEQKLSEDKQFMYPQPIQKISTNNIPSSAKFYSRKRPSRYKCTASIINTTINNDDTAIITKIAPITIVSKDAEDWDRYGWHRWDYAKSYLLENPEESLIFHTSIPNFLWNYVFFKKYDGDNEEISYDDYCARYSNITENNWKEAVMRSKMMYEDYPETTVSLLFILTDNNRTTENIYNNETHPYFSGYLDTTTTSMIYNYNNTSEFIYTTALQPGDPLLAKHLKESYMINSNNVLINYYGSLPYSEKCYAYTNDHENVYADYNYIETNEFDLAIPLTENYMIGDAQSSYLLYHFSPASENCTMHILQEVYEADPDKYDWNKFKNEESTYEYIQKYDAIGRNFTHPLGKYTEIEYYEDYDETLNSRVWYVIDVINEPEIAYIYHECNFYPMGLYALGSNWIYTEGSDLFEFDNYEYNYIDNSETNSDDVFEPIPFSTIPISEIPSTAKKYPHRRPTMYRYTLAKCDVRIDDDGNIIIEQYPRYDIINQDKYYLHFVDGPYLSLWPGFDYTEYRQQQNWCYAGDRYYDGYTRYSTYYSDRMGYELDINNSIEVHREFPKGTMEYIFDTYYDDGNYNGIELEDTLEKYRERYGDEFNEEIRNYAINEWKRAVLNSKISYYDYPEDTVSLLRLLTTRTSQFMIAHTDSCRAELITDSNDKYRPVNCNGYRCAETKIDYYLKDEFPLNTVPRVDLATDWQVNENHPEYTYWTDSDTNIEYAHIDPSLYSMSDFADAERLALFASIDYNNTCQDLVNEYQYSRTAQFKELGAFYFNVYDIDGNKVSTITRNYLRALILKGYVTVSYNDTPVMVYETSRFNDVCNNNHFVFTTPYYILFSKDSNQIYLYQTIQKQSIILNNVLVQDSNKTINEYFVTSRLDVVKNFGEQNAYTVSLTIEPTISSSEYITTTTDSDGNTIFTNSKVRVLVKFMKSKHEESDEYLELYPISQDENNKLVVTFSGTCVIDNSIDSNKTIVYVPKNSDPYTPYMDSDWNGDADSSDKIELPINGNILNIYILYTMNDDYSNRPDSMYGIANIYTTPINSFSFYKLITTMKCRTNQYDDNVYDNGENHVEIVSVPVIKANLIADNTAIHKLLSTVNTNISTAEKASTKFDNDINFDIKFYNTYGRSRNYVIEGDVAISASTDIEEDDKNTYIDTITSTDSIQYNHYTMDIGSVNISLSLDVYVSDSTDIDILDEKLRLHIKEFIESINKDGVNNLYISNLITSLEKEFDEIRYIKFNGIDDWGSSYQTITAGNSLIAVNTELFTQKFVTETNALYNSIPEFLNIRTDDITLNIITS